jgi:hypothetical protein
LAPFSPTPMPFETTSTFTTLHLDLDGFFIIFFKNYEPNGNLELFSDSFKLTFQCMSHLSTSGHFWMVFGTPSKLFSTKRFHKWIPTIVSTLFSYHTRPHSTSNCTYLWGGLLFNFNKALRWNLSHCYSINIILVHKPHFMPLNSRCICNTFLPSSIRNSNQGWMWNNNGWKHE